MESVILVMIAVANFMSMVHFGLYLVGANLYDVFHFMRLADDKRHSIASHTPLVSVIIPAHNEAVGIERTLNSVRASTYKHIEIIVIDDGSTDGTPEVVRAYIKRLATRQTVAYLARHGRLHHLRRRELHSYTSSERVVLGVQTNAGKAAAMNNAIKHYAHGSLVMCLDADSQLHVQAIEKAVAYFADSQVAGVAANVRVMGSNGWLDLLQRFEHMIGYRSKKFYSLTGTEFVVGGVASTYRRSVLEAVQYYDTDTMTEDIGLSLKIVAQEGTRQARIMYATDVVAMTEGVRSFRQLMRQRYRWKMGMLQNLYKYRSLLLNPDRKYGLGLTFYRLPVAIVSEVLLLCIPVMFGFIVYVSLTRHTAGILVGAYLTITLYTLCHLLPDEHFSRAQKVHMSMMALCMYILFYAMDIIQLCAAVRCLKEYKQITHGNQKHTTWISPTRSGQQTVSA